MSIEQTEFVHTDAERTLSQSKSLAPRHAEYLRARGVSRETAEAAGYWSASRPSEVPRAFSDRQRRNTPALIAPHLSPSGATGFQKRDDYPRKDRRGRRAKWVSPPGGRCRPILSVHPWTMNEAKTGTGPLWIPEGITRGHALAERGIAAVSYAGAWTWQKDGEPLECFDHLNLNGRLAYDVPDADYRTNENVQKALAKRVAFLESRGARVLVVSVPQVNGDPHAGLDDYLAAGGDLDELLRNAAPFVPANVGRERLGRNEKLRRGIEVVSRNADALEARKVRECSGLAIARYMAEVAAPDHGKPLADGVKVRPSTRQIAAGIGVGLGTISRGLEYLEDEAGFLKTLEQASGTRAASYLLLYAPSEGRREFAEHIGKQGIGGNEGQEHRGEGKTSLHQRESLPCVPQTRGVEKGATRPEKVPALRNSKVVHTWDRKDGKRVVVDSVYVGRYGKKKEAMIRHVLERRGLDERELHEKFGPASSRLRDFRRTWVKPIVDDGVWVADGSRVLPAPNWPEALERVRERTDEDGDNRLQVEKYRRQRAAFRERLAAERRGDVAKPEPVPDLVDDKKKTRQVFAEMAERDAERLEAERRAKLVPAVAFVQVVLNNLEVVRLGLLEDMWRDEGGLRWHLRRALREMGCVPKRHAEHPNEWFVHPPPEPECGTKESRPGSLYDTMIV